LGKLHLAAKMVFGVGSKLCQSDLVSLNFFDDVFVPSNLLFDACYFSQKEQAWVWKTEGEEFFLDIGNTVRCRVESDKFSDSRPTVAPTVGAINEIKTAPFEIICSIKEDGCGCPEWWD
jgi:DNA-directed RNA polymerase III subunit RPC8